jgi:tetratricopeptide (TPR) repeat protein
VGRLLAVMLVVACASEAEAQSAQETGLARTLYRDGLEAARAGRFQEAYDSFTRSLELSPRAATMLNLAGVEVELGKYVEALEHYRYFLRENTSTVRRHRATVEAAIADLEPRIAMIRITAPGILEGHRLLVDDHEIPHAALGGELPINPGAHTVRVEDEEAHGLGVTEFDVVSGETRDVQVVVVPRPPEVVEVPEEEPTIFESPIFWAATGGGVAAVIVIVVVVAVATSNSAFTETWMGNLPSTTGSWVLE